MTGHNIFQQMINENNHTELTRNPISLEDFELWKKDYTWDALHGIRYGQSFCNRFNIIDNILYYTRFPTTQECDKYIEKNYIARS
jgi:hypothetical protein